ncbi:hypothetical protein I4F81_011939 [Pyropia yezoensis]|uniref:Uncharacterized protein n=1 Tax=Pyropia yezoensis TaxID=2788 RepID=A0ACC3CI16_PYRYE|nr:hypothetical protein I4F81_011939 [Neopyropia yezoensis]
MAHLIGASSMMTGGAVGMPATHLPRFVPDAPTARGWPSSTARPHFAVPRGRPPRDSCSCPFDGGISGSPTSVTSVTFLNVVSPDPSTTSSPCASPGSRAWDLSPVASPDERARGWTASASDRSAVLMALASKTRGAAGDLALPPPPSRTVSDVSSVEEHGRAGGAPRGQPALWVSARKKGAADTTAVGHAVSALKKRVVGRFFGKAPAKPRQYAGWEEDTLR